MTKSFVKKGDKVLVITGKDKGKVSNVVEVSPSKNKVLVEGVNMVTKHQKPKSQQEKGGIVKKNAPIEASNVMVVCPACDKAVRVAYRVEGDKKVRICKKCGAILDASKEAKEVKKTTKRKTKKEVAEVPAEA